MAHGHFLVRNRHNNNWYGRVVIPRPLRPVFNNRREIRQSLGTPNKQRALRISCEPNNCPGCFGYNARRGLNDYNSTLSPPMRHSGRTSAFVEWLSQDGIQEPDQHIMADYIEIVDVLGRKHIIDMDNPNRGYSGAVTGK